VRPAKEWIANAGSQKDSTERQTGLLDVVTVRLLQEERAEAPHAAAGEIAQAQSEACRQKEHPKGGRGKHLERSHKIKATQQSGQRFAPVIG
jgi:hypothetical protein